MSEAGNTQANDLPALVNQMADTVSDIQPTLVFLRSAIDCLANQSSPNDNPYHLFADVLRGALAQVAELELQFNTLKKGIAA